LFRAAPPAVRGRWQRLHAETHPYADHDPTCHLRHLRYLRPFPIGVIGGSFSSASSAAHVDMDRELLIEIGVEELPASWLPALTTQVSTKLEARLKELRLPPSASGKPTPKRC
jgi:hypothetical protein